MVQTAVLPAPSSLDRRRRTAAALVLALAFAAWVTSPQTALAAQVTSAVFSGGFTAPDGTVYAKQGTSLTLTVTTDSATKCVDVTGAVTARRTTGSSPFTFSVTAGAGNGVQTATIRVGN